MTPLKILVACKRGNVADRNKWGHCLCDDCKAFRDAYRKANPRSEYKKKWESENKDKLSAYRKKWVDANKEKRRAIEKAWKDANPEKVAAHNSKAGSKWAKENKGKRMASVRSRQIAKLNRTPAWSDLGEISVIYREASRLTAESGINYEVDHVIPLQGKTVSGLHVPNNLRIITRFENRSKGNKL